MASADRSSFLHWLSGIVHVATEDYDTARALMLRSTPGFDDRKEWSRLIGERQEDACVMAWVFMHTGDQTLGRDLATETLTYLEETLPQYVSHGISNS